MISHIREDFHITLFYPSQVHDDVVGSMRG